MVCRWCFSCFIFSILLDSTIIEIIIFIGSSLVALVFYKALGKKYFNPKRVKTNYATVIGEEALVIRTIDNMNGTGQVIINGMGGLLVRPITT